jgi:hypothetical protein
MGKGTDKGEGMTDLKPLPETFVKITIPGFNGYVQPIKQLAECVRNELFAMDFGDEVTLKFKLLKMTKAEYDKLPEWEGY